MTDLSSIGVTPDLVVNAAIVLYVGKAMQNIMKVIGVTQIGNKTPSTIEASVSDIDNISTASYVDTNTGDSMQIDGARILQDQPKV